MGQLLAAEAPRDFAGLAEHVALLAPFETSSRAEWQAVRRRGRVGASAVGTEEPRASRSRLPRSARQARRRRRSRFQLPTSGSRRVSRRRPLLERRAPDCEVGEPKRQHIDDAARVARDTAVAVGTVPFLLHLVLVLHGRSAITSRSQPAYSLRRASPARRSGYLVRTGSRCAPASPRLQSHIPSPAFL